MERWNKQMMEAFLDPTMSIFLPRFVRVVAVDVGAKCFEESFTAGDLTIEAASSIGSARTINSRPLNKELTFSQVKKLLDSRNDREILEGLRKVISNVASPNIEIKRLVYIYLLHYAESEPDLALLSINTIQKSLTDQNPQIRALALRVMSGIRVPVISQIVSLAIKRGIADMSPHVRKAAALAIPKCFRLDPNTLPQLLEYLSTLLGDKQYFVAGPAVTAFLEVCPDRIDLLHKHYRALVRKLVDMDEWSQLATLQLLTLYSRKCFPMRTKRRKKDKSRGFYDEGSSGDEDDASGEEVQVLDPDLKLFLKACKPLLSSHNSAVIVSTARCLLHLGTLEDLDAAIGPLVALLRSTQDVQYVALHNIVAVCLTRPQPFAKYCGHFLIRANDPPDISRLKFEVLTLIFPHCEPLIREMILSELEHFTRSTNLNIVQESIRAIGRCAQGHPETSDRCLRLLLQLISSQDGNLVAESLTVIRHLIQQDPQAHVKTVIYLAKNLDMTTNPQARAAIIWLVGEFAGLPDDENVAPDVLRILAKGFPDESEAAKQQIALLAAKVYLHYLIRTRPTQGANPPEQPPEFESTNGHASASAMIEDGWQEPVSRQSKDVPDTHPIPLLWSYILHLTRYDTSYDLRDRVRLYRALLSDPSSTELASLLLLAPKPLPHAPSPSEKRRGLLLGSSTLVVGNGEISGYQDLPDWVREGDEPDPKLRDEVTVTGKGESSGGRDIPAAKELDEAVAAKGLPRIAPAAKDKNLDDWLNESDDGGSNEEETESEEEETESEEEESESASEGESTEDDEEDQEEEEEEEGERARLVR
ncbi:MAG: hypothetical protein Q9163_002814 [Psora crenata]